MYKDLLSKYGYCEGLVGTNEEGENVLVSITPNNASITTLQKNGWERVNIYYPDQTEEELYRR